MRVLYGPGRSYILGHIYSVLGQQTPGSIRVLVLCYLHGIKKKTFLATISGNKEIVLGHQVVPW